MVQMKSTSGRWPVRLFADWPGKVLLYQILLIPVSLHGCELPSQACCTSHTYSDRQDLISSDSQKAKRSEVMASRSVAEVRPIGREIDLGGCSAGLPAFA